MRFPIRSSKVCDYMICMYMLQGFLDDDCGLMRQGFLLFGFIFRQTFDESKPCSKCILSKQHNPNSKQLCLSAFNLKWLNSEYIFYIFLLRTYQGNQLIK